MNASTVIVKYADGLILEADVGNIQSDNTITVDVKASAPGVIRGNMLAFRTGVNQPGSAIQTTPAGGVEVDSGLLRTNYENAADAYANQ